MHNYDDYHIVGEFGKFTLFKQFAMQRVCWMNRSAKRLLIVSDNLVWLIMDIGQFHQIFPYQTIQPYKVCTV